MCSLQSFWLYYFRLWLGLMLQFWTIFTPSTSKRRNWILIFSYTVFCIMKYMKCYSFSQSYTFLKQLAYSVLFWWDVLERMIPNSFYFESNFEKFFGINYQIYFIPNEMITLLILRIKWVSVCTCLTSSSLKFLSKNVSHFFTKKPTWNYAIQ